MFIEKKELDLFFKDLEDGQTIRMIRDLSGGLMEKNMIQELSVRIYPENRVKVYELVVKYPVLLLELEN